MKIVIFGCGIRGKRLLDSAVLKDDEVIAFIDNDSSKIGTEYRGKKIISLQEYIEEYSRYFILISLLKPEPIKKQLEEKGITKYFDSRYCPSELHGFGDITFLNQYIETLLKKGGRYGIRGMGFYGIYLYDRLKAGACESLYLIPATDEDGKKVKEITESFEHIKVMPDSHWSNYVDVVLDTIGDMEPLQCQNIKNDDKESIVIKNVFDLNKVIPQYRNLSIKKFYNIHQGKRCFIVATGPSLRMDDLEKLRENNELSIGMNRLYLAFKKTAWRPNYYVIADLLCLEESGDIIKSLPVENKFISDGYLPFWRDSVPDNIYKIHVSVLWDLEQEVLFSEDITYGTYNMGTVVYDCLQIAVYMGFQEIYLLGVDFSFTSDYTDPANHFAPDYYQKGQRAAGVFKDENLKAFKAAKEYAECHNIKIYNATRGGKLEVFERVDFDGLFC